ncbi:MAG: hypothetical protein JNK05_06415 [Myxococcales bacterium]|nr:hypothetical protein [Myxococcales bacterium]
MVFVGAVALVAAGRMMAPPPEPERPRVEPEPAPIAAAIPQAPQQMPGGMQQQPQPAAPQGG